MLCSIKTVSRDAFSWTSHEHVSDGRDDLTILVFSKRRHQLQHLLVRRDFCLGDHFHHVRNPESIQTLRITNIEILTSWNKKSKPFQQGRTYWCPVQRDWLFSLSIQLIKRPKAANQVFLYLKRNPLYENHHTRTPFCWKYSRGTKDLLISG